MQERSARARLKIIATACLLVFAADSANAQSFSEWDADTRSAVRLLAAKSRVEAGTTILRAGVEIRLLPNWKTYHRDPGDSGVPPVFDFGGSENIKSVTVLWPAPERIIDGTGYTMGYKNGVVLPLHVLPRNATKPVVLRLKLDYAVCETLCVPAKAKVELALSGAGNAAADALVSAAEARVP